MGLEVLLFTVVLSWGQPETLPGWHMLVGEERTEVLTKTGRQMTATPASSSPSQGISVNRVADLFHHSIEDVWLVSIDVVGCALDLHVSDIGIWPLHLHLLPCAGIYPGIGPIDHGDGHIFSN